MAYDPRPVEPRIYKRWLDAGAFQPREGAEPYVIVIPPPNVTDILHVGHALNNVIQDVLIRFERMRGRAAEWLPGTDHAGIATQNGVEKRLAKDGKTRFDLGREQFVEEVWCFVKKTGNTIIEQHETQGNLYHINSPLEDGSGFVTVATTRPETMFGDIGLVFNPKDTRYKKLKGQRVKIPLSGIAIPIATDDAVDQAFGTGMLKVTPAHDANDFEIANRAWPKDEKPLILTEDAHMEKSARVPADLQGLDRFDARKKLLKQLEKEGLLIKTEQHQHSVRRCYRCDTVVEPRLSDQWFVKMQPLAEPALRAYRAGEVGIVPERWSTT